MFLLVLKSVNDATSLLNQPTVFETTAHQINLQSKFVLPNHRDLYVPNVRKTRYVRHFRDDQNSRILYLCQRFLKTVGDRFCKCQPVVHYYSLNCCFLCFCFQSKNRPILSNNSVPFQTHYSSSSSWRENEIEVI